VKTLIGVVPSTTPRGASSVILPNST